MFALGVFGKMHDGSIFHAASASIAAGRIVQAGRTFIIIYNVL